jgi:hypothetical protein
MEEIEIQDPISMNTIPTVPTDKAFSTIRFYGTNLSKS